MIQLFCTLQEWEVLVTEGFSGTYRRAVRDKSLIRLPLPSMILQSS